MRRRIRSLLLLILLGTVLLEALALVRTPLLQAVHRAYPFVALDEDARVLYYDTRLERGASGEARLVRVLDETRNAPGTVGVGSAETLPPLPFGNPGVWFGTRIDFDRPRFLRDLYRGEERFVPYTALESLARNTLNAVERRRRGLPDEVVLESGERLRPPIEWQVEENRLVCRETASGRAVAGLGPNGYARGEHSNEGERFGRIAVGPIRTEPGVSMAADRIPPLLLDRDARTIHGISVAKEEGSIPADSVEPVALTIDTRPLHPAAADAVTATRPYASIVGRHVLVFLEDGSVIADFEMEPNEEAGSFSNALVVQLEGSPGMYVTTGERRRPPTAAVGLQTALLPAAPGTARRRLRLFRPGHTHVVHDIALTPTRATEVALANLTAAFALLRPPPLAIASALSPLPADRRETWWWRDPWLAGGRYAGWLVASLALAGFCAWRGRRAARERCATVREVRLWTAAVFLLGPVGLLWMRFVLPRVPVEAVGGARRAVNLDASPSTSAPWPEPKPLGIEVFS